MKQLLTIMFVCGAAFAQTKATSASKAPTAAKKSPAPTRSLLNPSTLKATAPAIYKVKFTTTQGDFVLQVTRAWAPIGADRFYNLVRGGFYNGVCVFPRDSQVHGAIRHQFGPEGFSRLAVPGSSGRAGEGVE